jgi:putative Holliday junction resolvase
MRSVARALGLDVGDRRIGLAISTPEGRLAVPLRVLERTNDSADLAAINAVIKAESVELLVVGHPRSLAGDVGPQARRVEAFAEKLRATTELPVALWDERLTSVQAERSARAGGRRGPADDIAAAIILQAYLDRQQYE